MAGERTRRAGGNIRLSRLTFNPSPTMSKAMNTAKGKPDFGSAAGQPAGAATGAGVIPLSPAPVPPSLAAWPLWQSERARFLHRLCTDIEARVQAGEPVRRAVRRCARRWHGRPFRCAPGRFLRLSKQRLVNLFYEWRKQPSPEVFRLRYRAAATKTDAALVAALVSASLAPGVTSFLAAYRTLQGQAAGRAGAFPRYSTLLRQLPRTQRRSIRELHRQRLAARRALLKLERELGGPASPPSRAASGESRSERSRARAARGQSGRRRVKLPRTILVGRAALGAQLNCADDEVLRRVKLGKVPFAFDLRRPGRRQLILRVWPGGLPRRGAPALPDLAGMFQELFPGKGDTLTLRQITRAFSVSPWHARHLASGANGLRAEPRPRRQGRGSNLHFSRAAVLRWLTRRALRIQA